MRTRSGGESFVASRNFSLTDRLSLIIDAVLVTTIANATALATRTVLE
jgi:hypothetical protein